MKISEIYAFEPIKVEHDINMAIEAIKDIIHSNNDYVSFELESVIQIWEDSYKNEAMIDKDRFEVRIYMDESDDNGKYGARLYSIYFDGIPMMLVKNNGRYFVDYETYLTDKEQLMKFANYLIELAKNFHQEKEIEVFNPDEDINGVEVVGSYNLLSFYNPNLKPKYQIGDLVWAWVPENHLKYDFSDDYHGYVLTKVRITNVSPFNPQSTYFGSQRERGWHVSEDRSFSHIMQLYPMDEGFAGIGCDFNDSLIVGKVNAIPMPEIAINNQVDEQGFLKPGYKITIDDILDSKMA